MALKMKSQVETAAVQLRATPVPESSANACLKPAGVMSPGTHLGYQERPLGRWLASPDQVVAASGK